MVSGVNVGNLGVLKTNYEDLIVKTQAEGAKAFTVPQVKKWEGDVVEFRVHVKRNPNMGAVEDGGEFSTPGKQSYVAAKVGRRFFQTKLQISTGAMAAASSAGKGAFIGAMDSETQGITSDILSYQNKMFFRDGTGVVAVLKGSPANATANIQVDDTGLLWEDGEYEVRDVSASNAQLGNIKVLAKEVAIDSEGFSQFSLDTGFLAGAVSGSAVGGVAGTGDTLVWKGGFNRTISGLDVLVDDAATSSFQNVNTTTHPQYTSYVNSNSGTLRPVTPLLLRQTLAAVKQRMGNSLVMKPFRMWATTFISKEFEEMYEGALRIDNGATSVGLNVSSFNSVLGRIDVEIDADALKNVIFLCKPDELVHYVQKPLSFDKDGTQIFRNSHGALHATAIMTQISQMAIKDRKSSAKIKDVADNATVSR